MEEILEHFGTGTLCSVAGVLALIIFAGMVNDGGMLKEFVLLFMTDICG